MVNLSVNLCGLELRNPILPAVGPLSRDGDALLKVANNGAGGLVADTVALEPERVPQPYLTKVSSGLISARRGSRIPLKQWLNEEYPKAKRSGLPLIASVGHKPEDVVEIAPKVEEAGADALELVIHPLGQDFTPMVEAIESVKDEVDIPVLTKLSAQLPDVVKAAEAAEDAGAEGIVAIDAVGPCISIDTSTAHTMIGSENGYGWLSGPPIKPLALRCVADISKNVDVPVIGAGGISDERDVVEFIMAGASVVELCTAAIIRGTKIYGIIADGLSKFMRARGYDSLEDFRGNALRHLPEEPIQRKVTQPEVLTSRCTGCALCRICPYNAVRIVGQIARIDPNKCTGCGLCVSVCSPRALRF